MLNDMRILVTGGRGFLGSHVVEQLSEANDVFAPRSADYDLRDNEAVRQLFSDYPDLDVVIHAASDIGGIGYSSSHPGTQFYNNTLINLNIVHESMEAGVKKFVGVGSVCEYPAETPVPFREETIWDGYPVVTNDAYGLTKRMLLAQCDAYRRQFGFSSIHLLPVNLYGPRDDFDPENSHVIPALIRKAVAAVENGDPYVEVWGTGEESREFVYVDDAARAIVLATELYDDSKPVNIGSGREVTICELAKMICDLTGFQGEIRFANNGLGGQQRRMLDVSRAAESFGFTAQTDFEKGLRNTIDYYLQNKSALE